jgi:F-type H+-transporting ATPase subunit b
MSRHQRLFRRIALASSLAALPQAASAATGMPQLNFANPLTLDQVGWGAAIFVLFLLLSWVWGLPQVSSVLERRSAAIAADLEMARTAKTEADRAVAEMTDAIARARAEAQGSINAALEQAKQQAALQATALNEQLQTQLHEAELRINEARQTAMRALRQVATETAESVVARLTGIPAEPTRLQRAVAAALAARGPA